MNARKFLRTSIAKELRTKENRGIRRALRKANRKPSYFNSVAVMMGDYDAIR